MSRIALTRLLAATSLSAILSGTAALTATAGDIEITDAAIKAGKLVISGTTALPSTKLRLDGRSAEAFNIVSKSDRSFKFALAYMPKDCVASVSKLNAVGKATASTDLVISGCSPASLTPRGNWSAKEAYELNDIVTHKGSSWLARKDNAGQEPKDGESWQLLVAQGEAGEDGANGGLASQAANTASASRFSAAQLSAARAIPSGPAGGDLTGTYPNPQLKAAAVGTAEVKDFSITTTKLKNAAVTNVKLNDNSVSDTKIRTGAVLTDKIADGAVTSAKVLDESLTDADIAPLNGDTAIIDNTITTFDLATNSVDSDEVLDFGLSNEDVGVLFAQVNADATIFASSGGVTGLSLGTGTYEIDFGRDISNCAAVVSQGEGGIGGAGGAVMAATDRSGNAEAFFVTARATTTGTLTNNAFQIVVVC